MITDDLLVDLAAARVGGTVLAANDDFFAPKENLVADAEPIWDPQRYTDRGKWMDGWETRRRRQPGHDWAVLRLGLEGIVHRVVVDTAFFTGNYPESCSVDAAHRVGGSPRGDADWFEVIPRTPLLQETRDLGWRRPHSHLRGQDHGAKGDVRHPRIGIICGACKADRANGHRPG